MTFAALPRSSTDIADARVADNLRELRAAFLQRLLAQVTTVQVQHIERKENDEVRTSGML
jgi:hypothetical protein